MGNTQCNTCGGEIIRRGNYYVCLYCGNKWEIDKSNDVHAVERVHAWTTLREGDFEKATELFEISIFRWDNVLHNLPKFCALTER